MREDEGAGGYTRKIIEERSKIGINLMTQLKFVARVSMMGGSEDYLYP